MPRIARDSSNIPKVIITTEEYESLLQSAFRLRCLENAGVDNWSGYEYAMEEFYGLDDDEDE